MPDCHWERIPCPPVQSSPGLKIQIYQKWALASAEMNGCPSGRVDYLDEG
jgi:hypothetical protein